ncbi:uncharacterized protein LOC111440728, partial [Cucurbita moschata]|uniref:Uncharacterized protein LOC111440728 n=1 Tax=Cucurbita moschata TaxID=3662 RepID=A0A6J1EZK0_CUCMO
MTEESEYIRDFMKLAPPTFGGKGTDPEAAEWWLECIETNFAFYNCPESHKVLCATYLLEGPANFWWKSKKPKMMAGGAPITWAAFRHEFCEKYYPALARLRNRKAFMQLGVLVIKYYPALARLRNRKAFMQLEQGNRSVEEYEVEFTLLSRFVPLMDATEEEKTDLFIQGLRQEIQGSVSAHASQDFVTAYNAAVKLDASTPRNNQGSSSQQTVPQRVDRRPYSGEGRAGCSKCGLTHAGSCNAADKICYNCGKTGHLARVCRSAKNPNMMRPERSAPGGGGGQLSAGGHPQARGKAFATTSKAAGDASTVVT